MSKNSIYISLILQIGLNNCTFSILDTKSITYQYLESHDFEANSIKQSTNKLTAIINNSNVLKATYYSLSVAYTGFPNTLVPLSIYNKKDSKQILELNTKVFAKIFTDEIKINKSFVFVFIRFD